MTENTVQEIEIALIVKLFYLIWLFLPNGLFIPGKGSSWKMPFEIAMPQGEMISVWEITITKLNILLKSHQGFRYNLPELNIMFHYTLKPKSDCLCYTVEMWLKYP